MLCIKRVASLQTLHKEMKFSIKDLFSKLQIWSHLLMKSLMENFIFLAAKGKTQ